MAVVLVRLVQTARWIQVAMVEMVLHSIPQLMRAAVVVLHRTAQRVAVQAVQAVAVVQDMA